MSASLTITEARAVLPSLLDRVEAGEEIILTRHGKPVAVVVRPDQLSRRRRTPVSAAADDLSRLLDDAQGRSLDERPGLDVDDGWADERVAALRQDRDAW